MQQTVLIIDDNTMMGKFLSRLLQDQFNIVYTEDPAEALLQIHGGLRPNLIILDYQMEQINGLDWLGQFKKGTSFWGDMPILMLSGSKESAVRIKALELGVADFVLKPFHPQELKLRIERLMEQHYSAQKVLVISKKL